MIHLHGFRGLLQRIIYVDPANTVRWSEEHLAGILCGSVNHTAGQLKRIRDIRLTSLLQLHHVDSTHIRTATVDPAAVRDRVVYGRHRDVAASTRKELSAARCRRRLL